MKSSNPLRQKLINLMYLLLISMIVLNAPVEFIEAFTDLNRSLERSNLRMDQRTETIIRTITEVSRIDSTRFRPTLDRILTIKAISDSAVRYIDTIKTDLIIRSGGYKNGHLSSAVDATLPTRKMIRDGIALDLKALLIYTKAELLKYMDEANQTLLDTVLITSDSIPKLKGVKYKWQDYYFDNVPLGAVIALLSKFQNDVKLAETIMIKKFYDKVDPGVSFSYQTPKQVKIDTIVLEKAERRLDVFNLGDDASTRVTLPSVFPDEADQNAIIYTMDAKNNIIDSFLFNNGVGEIKLNTSQVGEFSIKGVVKYRYPEESAADAKSDNINKAKSEDVDKSKAEDVNKAKSEDVSKAKSQNEAEAVGQGTGMEEGVGMGKGTGKQSGEGTGEVKEIPEQLVELEQEYSFEIDYSVVNPKPYISNKDFDILYVGANNPVDIFHPEFTVENYKVSITQGKITYDGNQFYAKVYRTGFVTVTLEIPNQQGGYKVVAQQQFKAIDLPEPKAKLYNQYGGDMAASIFKKQKMLTTDFQGLRIDAQFRVMEFTLTYISKSGLGIFKENVKGSYFTDKSLELINLAEPGDIFIFENIRVKGPDGKNMEADALVFNII